MEGKWELDFWNTTEWGTLKERMEGLEKSGSVLNPSNGLRFRAMELTPFDSVRVCICGQDPYPRHELATGVALSIPQAARLPPTLANIFIEYCVDLHYPPPSNGDLTAWTKQGVFLWNVVPVCHNNLSLSCCWPEWEALNEELFWKLGQEHCVFVLLGNMARGYAKYIHPNTPECNIVELSHPSPRASHSSNHPFFGSRMFSTVNGLLESQGNKAIDWRLP